MVVVFEGTPEAFWNKIGEIIESKIEKAEKSRLVPIEKKEACRLLGISYPTLKERMTAENMETIFASDIERLRLKYPKHRRK